jgi:hypothetical protein
MPLDTDRLETTVRKTLSEELTTVSIADLVVSEDVDHDGDPILKIVVTVDVNGRNIEAAELKGLVRHLRSALAAAEEDRFPLLSFRVRSDMSGEPAETP